MLSVYVCLCVCVHVFYERERGGGEEKERETGEWVGEGGEREGGGRKGNRDVKIS